MISALQSAISGLQAFGTKLDSNANNVANVSTEGFKRSRVLLSDMQPQGVRTSVEKVNLPGAAVYDETSNGYELVELSNVDLGQELPDMNINSTFYKANLRTIQAADEMLGSLLKIKA